MTARFYAYTDPSAPVLTGQANLLSVLLKTCLVDGYGAKAPAGWTRPYYDAGTYTSVFQPGGSPTAYLQVQDNGPGAASTREARMRGYETMSAYNVGTGPFPTTSQATGGVVCRKSPYTDGTTKPWFIVADERRFHLFIETGDSAGLNSYVCFGAMKSYKPDDPWPFIIAGRPLENYTSMTASYEYAAIRNRDISVGGYGYLERSYTGVGSSASIGFTADGTRGLQSNGGHGGATGMAYPCPADGGLYMARTFVNEVNVPRGEFPGIWCPSHNRPLANRDTFSGTADLINRTFTMLWTGAGCLAIETSDTWDV